MTGRRWSIAVVFLLPVVLFIAWGCGMPPWTWIEKSRFATKAETALDTILSPALPPDMRGDVFTYPDGWIVVLYGQSQWTGHNMWNYNLAKDATGQEYTCERHFCTGIRHRYDMRKKSDESYLQNNPEAVSVPNHPDPELDGFKALIEARSLTDATAALTKVGFSRR